MDKTSIATRFFLTIFGLCVALLSLEVGLRIYTYILEGSGATLESRLGKSSTSSRAPLDAGNNLSGLIEASRSPDIVYELRPDLRGTFQGKPFQFNSFGIRDTEYQLDKPAETFRVVGIGDSVMFGWGVDEQDSYLSRIENLLNQRCSPLGRRFEMLNFAVPGYNSAMEVATLEHRAMAYAPDAVVLHFVSNDLNVPLFMQPPHRLSELSRSYLLDFVYERLKSADSNAPSLMGITFRGVDEREKYRVLDQYKYMVGDDGFKLAMQKLAQITKPRNIPVVIIVGSAPKSMRKLVRKVAALHGFTLLNVKPYVDKFLIKHGIPDNPRARSKALQVSSSDPHPNALGHEIYSEALLDTLGLSTGCSVTIRPPIAK